MNLNDFLNNPNKTKINYNLSDLFQLTLFNSIKSNTHLEQQAKMLIEIKLLLSDMPESKKTDKVNSLLEEYSYTINEAYRRELSKAKDLLIP